MRGKKNWCSCMWNLKWCPSAQQTILWHVSTYDVLTPQKPKIYFLFVFIFFLVLISFISLSSVPRTQSLWWNFISFTYITNSQISVTKSEKQRQRRRRRRRKWNLNVAVDLLRQRSSSNRSVFNSSSSSLFYWYNSNRFSLWICYEQFCCCCCCSWSPLKVVWFCLWILSRTHCDLHLD